MNETSPVVVSHSCQRHLGRKFGSRNMHSQFLSALFRGNVMTYFWWLTVFLLICLRGDRNEKIILRCIKYEEERACMSYDPRLA